MQFDVVYMALAHCVCMQNSTVSFIHIVNYAQGHMCVQCVVNLNNDNNKKKKRALFLGSA